MLLAHLPPDAAAEEERSKYCLHYSPEEMPAAEEETDWRCRGRLDMFLRDGRERRLQRFLSMGKRHTDYMRSLRRRQLLRRRQDCRERLDMFLRD